MAGVEAARRAGMRVIWVPHPDVAVEYQERQKAVLAKRTGMFFVGDDWQLGELDDEWAKAIPSLELLSCKRHAIEIPSQ